MKQSTKNTLQSGIWLLGLLAVWEICTRLKLVSAYILPPFSRVMETFFRELINGTLSIQILNSLYIIVQGFLISFLLAIVITLLATWLPSIQRLVALLCTIFNPLPAVALMPLIIMWFGIGTASMRVIIIHGVIWALLTHMLEGFRSIPVIYREWGTNINLKQRYMFFHIIFFAIMPEVIAGVRVAWGRAWRALISAEMVFGMIGTLGGLGYYIYTNRALANMPRVMSGVIAIILIGICVESLLFKFIERQTIQKWGMSVE